MGMRQGRESTHIKRRKEVHTSRTRSTSNTSRESTQTQNQENHSREVTNTHAALTQSHDWRDETIQCACARCVLALGPIGPAQWRSVGACSCARCCVAARCLRVFVSSWVEGSLASL